MNFDPDTQTHFDFHRSILFSAGIQLDIASLTADRVELKIQQIGDLDVLIGADELRERAAAIFRFLAYQPVVHVLPAGAPAASAS